MKRLGILLVVVLVSAATDAAEWPRPNAAVAPRPGLNYEADNPPVPAPTRPPTPAPAREPNARAASAPVQSPTAKYLVLLVLDGARPDYLNLSGLPHVQALMKHGVTFGNAFAGILESETPSGHATIASGSQPRQDGILSFDWANSDNTTIDLFSPNAINDHQMENIIQKAPAPDIAQLIHHADHSAKVVALSGHKYYAADALGGPSADAIMYYTGTPDGRFVPVAVPGHVPPKGILTAPGLVTKSQGLAHGTEDHLAMRLGLLAAEKMQPRALMINVPEFDWPLGHVRGASRDPALARTLMRDFDADLGHLEDLYRNEGILDQTVFVVTADHGFAPIYHAVSSTAIEHAVSEAGTNIVSDTFHTAGYIWIGNQSRAPAAALNIAQLRNPYIQSVYFKSPVSGGGYQYLRASGPDLLRAPGAEQANQYLLQTFNGPSGPDVVVFFDETAASEPGGQASWKGDHGGADWQSQHLPLVISGPGVRSGVVSNAPSPLMDIAPTALALMGIPHPGMQGVPLTDAFASPTAGMRADRQAQVQRLQPVVGALQREAGSEVSAGL